MLKKITNYYRRKKNMKYHLMKLSPYFKSGQYSYDENLSFIYLNNSYIYKAKNKITESLYENISSEYPTFKILLSKVLRLYLNKNLNIKNNNYGKKDNFQGELYLPGGSGTSEKIFDIIGNKVLVKYSYDRDFKKKIETYNYFKKHFQIPEIIYVDPNKKIIIERYIDYLPHDKWQDFDYELVMKDMFDSAKQYFSINDIERLERKSVLSILDSLDEKSEFLIEIAASIDKELIDLEIPVLKVHGDLWTSNILLTYSNPKNVFYIDWERSEKRFFLYDIFYLMWTEYYNKENLHYINSYFRGKYDVHLTELFEVLGIYYNPKYKESYFNIFIMEHYLRGWQNETPVRKERIYMRYKTLKSKTNNYTDNK